MVARKGSNLKRNRWCRCWKELGTGGYRSNVQRRWNIMVWPRATGSLWYSDGAEFSNQVDGRCPLNSRTSKLVLSYSPVMRARIKIHSFCSLLLPSCQVSSFITPSLHMQDPTSSSLLVQILKNTEDGLLPFVYLGLFPPCSTKLITDVF